MVARWAHNPKVVSSSLASATSKDWFDIFSSQFFYLYKSSAGELLVGTLGSSLKLKLLRRGLKSHATGCCGCGAVAFTVIENPAALLAKLLGFR